jgi:hypothetical protein
MTMLLVHHSLTGEDMGAAGEADETTSMGIASPLRSTQ